MLSDPGIKNAGSVDAKKHPEPVEAWRVVNMSKRINPAFGVEGNFFAYSVNNSGSSCRSCNFSGLRTFSESALLG
jgi:hypothetical protein